MPLTLLNTNGTGNFQLVNNTNSGRFASSTLNSEPVTGDVAFVKVYNGALPLIDIQTLHAAYKTRMGY